MIAWPELLPREETGGIWVTGRDKDVLPPPSSERKRQTKAGKTRIDWEVLTSRPLDPTQPCPCTSGVHCNICVRRRQQSIVSSSRDG